MRHATWLLNRFQRRQNGATAFENLKRVSYKKPLTQFGERCHWLEAERITHKYDPRWRTGVWLGRHSASDAHLIGTPGGVLQVRTVRRLTREQRSDDVSKRAFDKSIGSPRNLSGSARTREFLLTKTRSEELHAAEADAWRKPASATEPSSSARPSGSAREEGAQREPVDEQPQSQPDVGDSEMAAGTETTDAETTRRTRIVTKRSDPAVADRGSAQEDANLEQALASVDASCRVRTA